MHHRQLAKFQLVFNYPQLRADSYSRSRGSYCSVLPHDLPHVAHLIHILSKYTT